MLLRFLTEKVSFSMHLITPLPHNFHLPDYAPAMNIPCVSR